MSTHAHVRRTPRPKSPCRKSSDIRFRLAAGARTIIVDVDGLLELDDTHFAGAIQAWTMRITGVSQVRINLTKRLPKRVTIVATDASTVQVTGFTEIHAYTNATVDAFDACKVTGHNNSTINACDRVEVAATEDTTVNAYDTAEVHATDKAVVNAAGKTRVILHDDATATAERGVTVLGPGRHNITVRS
ncbi:hypothetical protein [Rhodococcus qingshengii]|uniref:Uncharacterized protein n=1 Tax=Rhodococcus qingshengii TaxID=334542 RepID=A0A2A5IY17_RHOSG|nr:hypothetical protein [Rhodococcus qingshengii]PCK22006.1 hypothetical protein CHR55_33255 [Rhodococcus qingshengii]